MISIHAPRVGSDAGRNESSCLLIFQSTLPAWGATSISSAASSMSCYFNPRSPRGERRDRHGCCHRLDGFQSTLPAWGATATAYFVKRANTISIHAPRVGSDDARRHSRRAQMHFNPRSPRGERLSKSYARYDVNLISIHAPRVGSDRCVAIENHLLLISIHAPRVGSDTIS